MAKYKLSGDGVQDIETGAIIPNDLGNRDWQEYLEWFAEGNTPDPQFTQEELDQQALVNEIISLRNDLKNALVWEFRMILTLWDIGVSKGIWSATDVTDEVLKQKVIEWKSKLDRLEELGE